MFTRKPTLCAIQTLLRTQARPRFWLPAEVMKELVSLKTIFVLSVGLSFLVIILLSHWRSTVTLHRLDENYGGKKTLHLKALKNAQQIH